MSLEGDDSSGWTWRVWADDVELLRTEPLARLDLGAALHSISRDDSRKSPFLCELTDDELYFVLNEFFFGRLHDALRASAEEQTWARHLVSPSVPAPVAATMYLIGGRDGEERLIIHHEGRTRSYSLAEGSFDEALRGVIRRLDEPE